MKLRLIIFILCAAFSYNHALGQAPAANSQQTAIGVLALAQQQRSNALHLDITANPLVQYSQLYRATNGGPVLDSIGIHFLPMMGKTSWLSWILGAIMVFLMRVNILKAMHAKENVPKVMADMILKFMLGVFVMNYPDYTYAMGMMVRDSGVAIMKLAFQALPDAVANANIAAAPSNINFEMVRVQAIRRAIRDSSSPIIGTSSNITYDLYDQFAQRCNAATPGNANALTIAPIDGTDTKLQKTRELTEKMPLLLEALSKLQGDTGKLTWTAKRVSPSDSVEINTYGPVTSLDISVAATAATFYAGTTVYPSSKLTLTAGSLKKWTDRAETVKTTFKTRADAGGFATVEDLTLAASEATRQYDALIYNGTSTFIKQTFWNSVGFASGDLGGALSSWGYVSGSYTPDQVRALGSNVAKLSQWYRQSTGRVGASYSDAQPADHNEISWSTNMVQGLAYLRNHIIASMAFKFFDAVIECYIFVMFLAFPFWFWDKTAKAFTGGLNTFIVCCITPAALTLVYVIFDAFMAQVLSLMTFRVFDTLTAII